MALIDLLTRLASRPAGRVVEAPVRDLVQEALRSAELASPQEVQELRGRVMDANTELVTLGARVGALDQRLAEVLRDNEQLRARLYELEQQPGEPEPEPAPQPKLVGAPTSDTCKLPDCDNRTRSKGFCQKHYASWRSGDLPGFVGPEGLLEHRGKPLRVDAEYQGQPVAVSGSKRLTVKVAGSKVDFDEL